MSGYLQPLQRLAHTPNLSAYVTWHVRDVPHNNSSPNQAASKTESGTISNSTRTRPGVSWDGPVQARTTGHPTSRQHLTESPSLFSLAPFLHLVPRHHTVLVFFLLHKPLDLLWWLFVLSPTFWCRNFLGLSPWSRLFFLWTHFLGDLLQSHGFKYNLYVELMVKKKNVLLISLLLTVRWTCWLASIE